MTYDSGIHYCFYISKGIAMNAQACQLDFGVGSDTYLITVKFQDIKMRVEEESIDISTAPEETFDGTDKLR